MFFEDLFGGPGGFQGRGGPQRAAKPVDTDEMYNRLGVEKNATKRELKKAWRKLCKTHHPDRGGEEAEFKKVEQAYNILNDPAKRELYDQGGLEAVQSGHTGSSNIFDLFGGHGHTRGPREPQKPAAIKQLLEITLEEVYTAPTKTVEVTISTATDRKVCDRCDGRGSVMETVRRGPMLLQTQRDCRKCDGEGVSFTNKRQKKNKLEFLIPRGVKDGEKITLESEGHDLPGMPTGDVIIILKIKKHIVYKRLGADLAIAKELTLVEALCGFSFNVRHINGEEWLNIKSKPGQVVQPGHVICITEKGLCQRHNTSNKGNLYVKFTVCLPQSGSIDNKTKQSLCNLLGDRSVKYKKLGQDQNDTREMIAGSKVRLIGLQNRPDLNGVSGEIIESNVRPGQYAVHLKSGQTVAIRGEFLEFTDEMEIEVDKTEGPSKDDYVEDVTGDIVDGKIQHTPAAHGHHDAYDSDDEEHGHGQPGGCRQM